MEKQNLSCYITYSEEIIYIIVSLLCRVALSILLCHRPFNNNIGFSFLGRVMSFSKYEIIGDHSCKNIWWIL